MRSSCVANPSSWSWSRAVCAGSAAGGAAGGAVDQCVGVGEGRGGGGVGGGRGNRAGDRAWKADQKERRRCRGRRAGKRTGHASVVALRWRQAEAAYDRWCRHEQAWHQAASAFALFNVSGQLQTRAQAEATVAAA